MKNFTPAALCGLILLLACSHASAAAIISPDGSLYTSVTAENALNAGYVIGNLFNQSPTVGVEVSTSTVVSDSGFAYARSGGTTGLTPVIFEFQLDAVYEVQSLFYAQRDYLNAHVSSNDKVGLIEIWASSTTPYAAADPGVPAHSSAAITNLLDDKYLEYALSNTLTGRYFAVRLTKDTNTVGGYIGGTEFRLGGSLAPVPEPSRMMLGSLGLVICMHRRRRAPHGMS